MWAGGHQAAPPCGHPQNCETKHPRVTERVCSGPAGSWGGGQGRHTRHSPNLRAEGSRKCSGWCESDNFSWRNCGGTSSTPATGKPRPRLCLQIKFYWNMAAPIHLLPVHGHCHTTSAGATQTIQPTEENLSCPVLEGAGGRAAVQPLSKLQTQVHTHCTSKSTASGYEDGPVPCHPETHRAHHGTRGRTRDTAQAHPCFWSRLLMTLGGGAPGRRANHRQRQDPAWKSLLSVSQGIPSSKGHPKPSYKCLDSGGACPQCSPPTRRYTGILRFHGSTVSTGWSVKASSTIR